MRYEDGSGFIIGNQEGNEIYARIMDYELDVRKIREIRNVDSKIFCRRCGSGKVRRQSR